MKLIHALPALLVLVPACVAPGPPGQSAAGDHPVESDPAIARRIDAVFADHAGPGGPGCSLGVIRDGSLVHAGGYGSANLDHGIPNGPRTIFRVGSVAKQFTAGAAALLAVRGELDLDAPVRSYIPELPDYPEPPTVRHLVHHTSGVRDYLLLMSLAGARADDFYTDQEVLDAITRQRELNFTPGSDFLYSNSGYFLLGEIVARVSGQSLRNFAQDHFFGPLGMDRTHFHDDHNEIVPDRATGYAPARAGSDASPPADPGASDEGGGAASRFRISVTTLDMVGDGGIFTSVEDWTAWDRNLDDGTVGGPEWVAQMHQRGVLDLGDTIPYAFGIVHGSHRGLATVAHDGGFVGYRASMARYPETGHSFVAFCNGAHIVPSRLIAGVAEAYLGDRMEAAPTADGMAESDPEAEEPSPGDEPEPDASPGDPTRDVEGRARYAGAFHSDELMADYRIRADGEAGLALEVGRLNPAPLLQESDSVLVDRRGMTFRFSALAGGRYQAMTVDAGRVRNLRFARTER